MSGSSLFVDRPLPYRRTEVALAAVLVARDPAALEPHLRRLDACDDVSQVYGALVDLFIGLPRGAVDDRRAALARFGRALADEELAALEARAEDGLEAADAIPMAAHSLLTAGCTGHPVVARTDPTTPPDPHGGHPAAGTGASRGPLAALVALVLALAVWRWGRRRART